MGSAVSSPEFDGISRKASQCRVGSPPRRTNSPAAVSSAASAARPHSLDRRDRRPLLPGDEDGADAALDRQPLEAAELGAVLEWTVATTVAAPVAGSTVKIWLGSRGPASSMPQRTPSASKSRPPSRRRHRPQRSRSGWPRRSTESITHQVVGAVAAEPEEPGGAVPASPVTSCPWSPIRVASPVSGLSR